MRFTTKQTALYYGGITLSVAPSVLGILYAIYRSGTCVDGQRGGAIGTAAAFFILFMRLKYGSEVFALIFEEKKNAGLAEKIGTYKKTGIVPNFTPQELSRLVVGVLEQANLEADAQWLQNIALFAASAIGTIARGFGDIIASWSCKCN